MNQMKKNWRKAVITPDQAVDVKSTKMLSGLSSETPSQNASNTTEEYTTGRTSPGSVGAENTYE